MASQADLHRAQHAAAHTHEQHRVAVQVGIPARGFTAPAVGYLTRRASASRCGRRPLRVV